MTAITSAWSDDFYTQDQLGKLAITTRQLHQTGTPQEAIKIELQMEARIPYEEIVFPHERPTSGPLAPIRPETNINPTLVDEPPRSGKGSGHKSWAEFASLVSTIDDEVLEQFSRDEIISILVDRDIIDASDS